MANWIFEEYGDDLKVVFASAHDYYAYLSKNGVALTPTWTGHSVPALVNWEKYNSYSFVYDRRDFSDTVEAWLRGSALSSKKSVLMAFRVEDPAVEIPVDLFISGWESFVRASVWETVVVSDDLELVMEFTHDEWLLYSNFPIAPIAPIAPL